MPANTSPDTSTKRTRAILIISALLLLLVVGSLAAWRIYHSQQVSADKARFAQAERDIDELSEAVVAATGQPAKVQIEKYCSRPNMKFEDGPLSCDIHWYGYYEVADATQATALYKSARTVFTAKWPDTQYQSLDNESIWEFRELTTNDSLSVDPSLVGNYERIIGKVITSNSINCSHLSGLYLRVGSSYENIIKNSNSKYIFVSNLNCGDRAKIEHFPMKS